MAGNFTPMMKNQQNPQKDVLARALFKPDNLVWLAVLLMLFTFFRVLWYI